MKPCAKCGEPKPLEDFAKKCLRRDGSQRYHSYCKPCHAEYTRQWKQANSDQARSQHRRDSHASNLRKYGLTPEDYEAMSSLQGGVCVICEGVQTKG